MFRHTRRLRRHLGLEHDCRGLLITRNKSNGMMDALEDESRQLLRWTGIEGHSPE